MTRLRLLFHTPLFSKGSYDDRPEVRPASIRGQLHWWFRALGHSAADENAVFGSVHGKPVLASKVVVRVAKVEGQTGEVATLPHKRGGQASPKWAYLPGSSFELILAERLGGLDEHRRKAFHRALEAWLLLGTLGLRATRAGGSFDWGILDADGLPFADPPASAEDYETRCRNVLDRVPLRFHLLPEGYGKAEDARTVVSDTIGGRDDRQGDNDLARLNHPLGRVFGGRKTSPLRFRIVKFPDAYRIAAIWDDRSAVTGNQPGDLKGVAELLAERGKEVGRSLSRRL